MSHPLLYWVIFNICEQYKKATTVQSGIKIVYGHTKSKKWNRVFLNLLESCASLFLVRKGIQD